MTTPTAPTAPRDTTPDVTTGDQVFDAYTAALSSGETPILGHLVLYSIFDGEVTRDDMVSWFAELGLDPQFLPPPLRNVDAYERVTGPDGVRLSYPIDDPASAALAGAVGDTAATLAGAASTGRRRRQDVVGQAATLMVRPVRRDGGKIVRHVVREVRDAENTQLTYDTRIGVATFHRDNSAGSAEGAGSLDVEVDHVAVATLPAAEQAAVAIMLQAIRDSYQHRCRYLTGDKLRGVVRRYVEHLGAIKVRATGGVYFVHRQHAEVLAALRELVSRFEGGSHLVRVPLPDQDEMREMVVAAFTTKAKEDLDRLARDIAAARYEHAGDDVVQKLYRRFTELQQITAEHATLLSTSLEDTTTALDLVKLQLGSFLATAGTAAGDEPDDTGDNSDHDHD